MSRKFLPLLCFSGIGFREGLAKEKNGLYYLETPNASKRVTKNFPLSLLKSSNKDAIWLHHFRLGHPSFGVLKSCSLLCLKD